MYNNNRRFVRRGPPRSNRFGGGARIDVNKYINKTIVSETVEAPFVPAHRFADFPIQDKLKKIILGRGYDLPTPIQDRTIPHILQGKDVVGIANTGTGKTAAFLIPFIEKVLQNPKEQVMIMAPTRELALQINEELKAFTRGLQVFSVVCVGGMSVGFQLKELRYHNQFIVGTPGRLKDLVERRAIDLSRIRSVVLDEADRMLDMGFIHDMRALLGAMSKDRQTLFFSATLSPEIDRLIKDFLKDPVRVSVKTRDTSKNIDQDVVRIGAGGSKIMKLQDLLKDKEFTKVIVFGKTKHGVERVSKMLQSGGVRAESLHGDKEHRHRQKALKSFKDNELQVLVATDVAARGLDIADVSHVINFDLPSTYEDYIHRIGRTGRGTKSGKALTFID